MKYTAYESYIDYLFTQPTRRKGRDPYDDFRVDIVSSGTVESYCPPDGSYTIPSSQIKSIDTSTMSPRGFNDWRASILGENNGMYAETDLTYDEVFNEPASGKIDQCKYIDKFAEKAHWDAIVKKYANDVANDVSTDSQRYDSSEDLIKELAAAYPFKQVYDEKEYDQYGIPLTFLNGEEASVTAANWRCEGDDLTVSVGALISIDRPSDGTVVPVGFIDFEKTSVCNTYELQFDPSGLLKLK